MDSSYSTTSSSSSQSLGSGSSASSSPRTRDTIHNLDEVSAIPFDSAVLQRLHLSHRISASVASSPEVSPRCRSTDSPRTYERALVDALRLALAEEFGILETHRGAAPVDNWQSWWVHTVPIFRTSSLGTAIAEIIAQLKEHPNSREQIDWKLLTAHVIARERVATPSTEQVQTVARGTLYHVTLMFGVLQ